MCPKFGLTRRTQCLLGMVTANANQKRSTLVLALYRKDHSKLIRCVYIGEGTPPTRNEGGVTIKIQDKEFQLLSIAGKYSALTLDNLKMDVNLTTRGTTVVMTDISPDHISVDSIYNNYSIETGSMRVKMPMLIKQM